MRKTIDAERAEKKRLADEKEAIEKEAARLRDELAKRDVVYDPEFERKYVAPAAEVVTTSKSLARRFGVDEGEVERMLRMPTSDFAEAIGKAKYPDMLKRRLEDSFLRLSEIEESKQAALSNATATQMQLAEARRTAERAQFEQMVATRNATFQSTMRKLVHNAPKLFDPTAPATREAILQVKALLDPVPGQSPTDQFAAQVEAMARGAVLPRVQAQLDALQARYDALVAEAKKRNLPLSFAENPPPAAPPSSEPQVLTPAQLIEAKRRGEFREGGKFDRR